MDLYWEMERLRALQDTPHIREQQSGFLRPVVQPNNNHWMPESSNSTFAQQNEFGRCMICDSNHPSDQCIYRSECENFWRQACNEKPSHFTEPHFPSYPPSTFDFHQQPEPSEQDQILHMFKEQAAQFDAQVQSNAETIQRLTDQLKQLKENQNNIPPEPYSDDTGEAFEYQSNHDDTFSDEEAEQYQQPEVSVQEPIPVTTLIDFYISDSDIDDDDELFVSTAQTKIEEGFLFPQDEDLGSCFAMMFEEELPTTEGKSLQTDTTLPHMVDDFEDCFAQMFDENSPEPSIPAKSEDENLCQTNLYILMQTFHR